MAISENELFLGKFFDTAYIENPPLDSLTNLEEKLNAQKERGAEVLSIGYIPKTEGRDDYYSFVTNYNFSKKSFAGQISVTKETTEQYLLERKDFKERSEEIRKFLKVQHKNEHLTLPI